MSSHIQAFAAVIAVTLCTAIAADAATQSPAINVSASVVGNCTTVTPNPVSIAFANYDPFTYPSGTPEYDNTAVSFSTNCTSGDSISWTVGIGSNCGHGSIANDRAMKNGTTNYLSYELFSAASGGGTAYTTNGCGTPAANAQTGNGTATANTFTVYGSIPGGQNSAVGSYTDSVTVTLSY